MNNRTAIESQQEASCLYCFRQFHLFGVSQLEWTDGGQTAICPDCGVDAVEPGILSRQEMEIKHKEKFKT